jgi:sec-independent protein translocase protein TatC
MEQFHQLAPEQYAAPPETLKDKSITIDARSDDFAGLRRAIKKIDDPITLNVQEAFMTYIKVSLISGLVLSSPWIFYQLWLFVAAGLYPHERKYVYTYLPMSIGLFLGGVFFCFYGVFPTVLDFLLGFNQRLQITAQIRISEWINFAVMMPLLFGVSFQLPLVMLFLQKISIFQVADYRSKRRLAILAIAFLAMILTPTPDPMSMLLMMAPMLLLYELGIVLCLITREKDEELSPSPA